MSLFELQPESCRAPLPPRALSLRGRLGPVVGRVIAYDPGPAFGRITLTADPTKRIQTRSNISMEQLFPKKGDGCCDCGCGQALVGRRSRWAGPACSEFAWYVYAVIAGRRDEIRRCLRAYYGRKCAGCKKMPLKFRMPGGRLRSGLEADHIVPVSRGGGACWLSNYHPLCVACHREKTYSRSRHDASLKAL